MPENPVVPRVYRIQFFVQFCPNWEYFRNFIGNDSYIQKQLGFTRFRINSDDCEVFHNIAQTYSALKREPFSWHNKKTQRQPSLSPYFSLSILAKPSSEGDCCFSLCLFMISINNGEGLEALIFSQSSFVSVISRSILNIHHNLFSFIISYYTYPWQLVVLKFLNASSTLFRNFNCSGFTWQQNFN